MQIYAGADLLDHFPFSNLAGHRMCMAVLTPPSSVDPFRPFHIPIPANPVRTVVMEKDDDCVVGNSQFIELLENPTTFQSMFSHIANAERR